MKTHFQITAKQLVLLALMTAVFAASAVVLYDRFSSALLGRLAGAKPEKATIESSSVAGLTDPSVATDEKNNQEVYRALSPGVVNITSTVMVRDWFFEAYPKQGTGSGSILDKEGHILTNYHVIQEAEKLVVTLSNKHEFPATVLDADADNDLAVIKIEAPAAELTPVPLGNSKEVFVGQKVLAIGNPFGLEGTLTTGIVSGLSRPIRSEISNRLIEGVIQTDAAINPGNSGGPLLNSRGQMIGINTLIYSPSGGSVGIGFAVPVDTARRVINDVLQYGRVRKPRLGIVQPIQLQPGLSRALSLPVSEGLLVVGLVSGGPAEKAGVRGPTKEVQIGRYIIPVGGDIIVGVDGHSIKSQDDLDRVLNSKNIGDRVQVEVMRAGRKMTLTVQLAELPGAARRRT
ncbi:MAG: trypsin-like peptidase domain-containing protein [Acidobacteria bacterium]|nr:trypsin-like peptidase domain-containing protein [Acidobacteriota bacterium]